MKFILTSFILLFGLTSNAQTNTPDPELDTSNVVSKFPNGFKKTVGRKGGNGPYIRYYENGQIMESGNYVNGKLDGLWTEYYIGGQTKIKIAYSNDVLNGIYEKYYENGELKYSGEYVNGKRHGDFLRQFPNGETRETRSYINGKKDGEWTEYDEKGKIISKVTYVCLLYTSDAADD